MSSSTTNCVPARYQHEQKEGSRTLGLQLMAGNCHQTQQQVHVPEQPAARERRDRETEAGPGIVLLLGHSADAHCLWGSSFLHLDDTLGCESCARTGTWQQGNLRPYPTHLCTGLLKPVLNTGKCFVALPFLTIAVRLTEGYLPGLRATFFFLPRLPCIGGR